MAKTKNNTTAKNKAKKEKLYKILLHNDNKTTIEFVICLLIAVFEKNETEAEAITLDVHKNGIGIAGVYPLKEAQIKMEQTQRVISTTNFPLQYSMEAE